MALIGNNTEVLDPAKLSRSPYRGLISEIAREENVTVQAIWGRLNRMYQHKATVAKVRAKMREREAAQGAAA